MDPSRNAALHNAKVQTLNTQRHTSTPDIPSPEDMPAPPAYHMVVDPNMSIPNVRNPYDLEDEKDEDEEAQEIHINAATQVRGNGNIISIAQYDSIRLANLIAFMLNAARTPEPASPTSPQTQQPGQTLPSIAALSENDVRKPFPKININVNCGATVIGDRNIVGPGLGDIARQVQLAQRNQAMHARQPQSHQQQQAPCQGQAQRVPSVASQRETLYQAQQTIAQNHGVLFGGNPTPPMSRSPSLQSEEERSGKRKADDGGSDEFVKRRR